MGGWRDGQSSAMAGWQSKVPLQSRGTKNARQSTWALGRWMNGFEGGQSRRNAHAVGGTPRWVDARPLEGATASAPAAPQACQGKSAVPPKVFCSGRLLYRWSGIARSPAQHQKRHISGTFLKKALRDHWVPSQAIPHTAAGDREERGMASGSDMAVACAQGAATWEGGGRQHRRGEMHGWELTKIASHT